MGTYGGPGTAVLQRRVEELERQLESLTKRIEQLEAKLGARESEDAKES